MLEELKCKHIKKKFFFETKSLAKIKILLFNNNLCVK